MIGWVVFILIVVILCMTVLIAIEMAVRKGVRWSRRTVLLLDFKDWRVHKMIHVKHIRKPILTGNIFNDATPDQAIVLEKNWLKTPHVVDMHDFSLDVDAKTGGTLLINKVSIMRGTNNAEKERMYYELELLRSELGQSRAENLELKSQMEHKIESRLESMSKLVKATQPMFMKPKTGGSGGGQGYGGGGYGRS